MTRRLYHTLLKKRKREAKYGVPKPPAPPPMPPPPKPPQPQPSLKRNW